MSRPCVRRRNAAPALVGALACVLALLVAAPADASPGAAKWPWVSAQAVQGSKVAVHVAWNKVARSKKYRISYAPLKGRLNAGEVSTSRSRKTRTVRRVAGKVQGAWISGLKPGRFYCFQVQGLSGRKTGRASGMHCKMTTRTSRVRPVAGTDLAIATYNTCSTACASTLHTDWDTVRRPLVEQRIREMRAASTGRPVDVVAVEEGNDATSDLTTDLAGTFTRACQTGDGTGNAHEDNQSVFLRDGAWEVAPGSQPGGMNFRDIGGDGSHGACWARIRSLATGREAVVVALHLYAPSTEAGDRIRKAQTEAVVAAVNAAHPGATIVYAGDFNSWRGRADDAPQKVLAAHAYDDAFDPALVYGSLPFLTSSTGTSPTPAISPNWAGHLDRVFVSPGVHVASWKVDYRLRSGKYVAPMASDHNPVVVQLRLPS